MCGQIVTWPYEGCRLLPKSPVDAFRCCFLDDIHVEEAATATSGDMLLFMDGVYLDTVD